MSKEPTWIDALYLYPHFVEWAVQRFGPIPDGPIKQKDYERFKAAYEKEHGLNA